MCIFDFPVCEIVFELVEFPLSLIADKLLERLPVIDHSFLLEVFVESDLVVELLESFMFLHEFIVLYCWHLILRF